MIDRIFLSVVALTLVNCSTALGQTRQPNIVLLIADDLGYRETGCQGNAEIPTPHIDSIAAGGARFTGGYVTAAFCSASRAGLITGRYQTRFGYEFNPIGARNEDPDIGLPWRLEDGKAVLVAYEIYRYRNQFGLGVPRRTCDGRLLRSAQRRPNVRGDH